MSIAAALAELIRSPALFDHIAHLERFAEEEQRRREQFRASLDGKARTEFINGQVVIHADESQKHRETAIHTATLLGKFVAERGLGKVRSEHCHIRCQRNDYQPDICFFGVAKSAGLEETQPIFPPPELIVEVISFATEANDRQLKLQDYAAHAVGEYWIVDPDHRLVEQYVLLPGAWDYELKARLAAGGQIVSTVVGGFSAPVAALFSL